MTEEQLAKLAVAREKALVVRRQQKVEKLKAEAVRLEATQVGSNEETEQQTAAPTTVSNEEPKEVQKEPPEDAAPPEAATPRVKKQKKAKKGMTASEANGEEAQTKRVNFADA